MTRDHRSRDKRKRGSGSTDGLVGFQCSECGTYYRDRPPYEPALAPSPHADRACLAALQKVKASQVQDLQRTDQAIAVVIGRMRARQGDRGRPYRRQVSA